MGTDYEELGRRLLAWKGWHWKPGASDIDGSRLAATTDAGDYWAIATRITGEGPKVADLRDDATLGCLLGPVRAAWHDQGLCAHGMYFDGGWHWRIVGGKPHGSTFHRLAACWFGSEAEALIAAAERSA